MSLLLWPFDLLGKVGLQPTNVSVFSICLRQFLHGAITLKTTRSSVKRTFTDVSTKDAALELKHFKRWVGDVPDCTDD